jgi:hypothetical protein
MHLDPDIKTSKSQPILYIRVPLTQIWGRMYCSGISSSYFYLIKKTIGQGAATTVYCSLKPDLERDSGQYFDNFTLTNLVENGKTAM